MKLWETICLITYVYLLNVCMSWMKSSLNAEIRLYFLNKWMATWVKDLPAKSTVLLESCRAVKEKSNIQQQGQAA